MCRYYSRKIDFQNHFGDLSPFDESISEPSTKKKADTKQSPSHDQSKSSNPFDEDIESDDKLSENSVGQYFTKQAFFNNENESISLIERTSKKLLPIYQEVLKIVSTVEKHKPDLLHNANEDDAHISGIESSDIDSKIGVAIQAEPQPTKKKPAKTSKQPAAKKDDKKKGPPVDMRHILGFLNQTEWIQNLNIGNIMQIAPLKLDDLYQIRRNEEVMNRE